MTYQEIEAHLMRLRNKRDTMILDDMIDEMIDEITEAIDMEIAYYAQMLEEWEA
jgi:hypothetical protein